MSEEPIVDKLKEKLQRTLKSKAVLAERSKQLTKQVEDFRKREDQTEQVMAELLERQRELNFMLHRASSVLYRIQEANSALSTEFTELVKELPAPNAPDWEERVNRINDLFKMSGSIADEVQDDVFSKGIRGSKPAPEIDPAKNEPAASVEPVDVPEAETVPEPVLEESVPAAEFFGEPESTELFEPESESGEPEPEPVIVEAQFSDPDPVNPNVRKRLDQLFSQAGADVKKESVGFSDEDTSDNDEPGFFSRIWSRIFKKRNGESAEDADIRTEPEMILPEPEPEPVEEKAEERAADADQTQQPVVAELSSLLEDTAYELEQIPMELIPDKEPQTGFVIPAVTVERIRKPVSLWARLTKRFAHQSAKSY